MKDYDLIQIGSVVQRKDDAELRSGAEAYKQAIVISVDPFLITSFDASMLWTFQKKNNFYHIALIKEDILERCMKRLPKDVLMKDTLKEVVESIAKEIGLPTWIDVEVPDRGFRITAIQEPTQQQYWGYLHQSGTVHVKRFFDKRDIDEAHESPFIASVMDPIYCKSSKDAERVITNYFKSKF